MKRNKSIIPDELIARRILFIRGQKVIIDSDLSLLYGVTTKRLNEQIKRNPDRFPEDFLFQLTEEEKLEVVANCDHLKKLKFSPYLPSAFTEYGVLMAANVLSSSKAIQVSVQIIRTFVRLRQLLSSNEVLAHKLNELEKRYDEQFKIVFDALRQLLTPPEKPKHPFGFTIEEPKIPYQTKKQRR